MGTGNLSLFLEKPGSKTLGVLLQPLFFFTEQRHWWVKQDRQESSAGSNTEPCRASLGTHSNAQVHLMGSWCIPGSDARDRQSFPVLNINSTPKFPRLQASMRILSPPTTDFMKAGSYTPDSEQLTSTHTMPASQNSCRGVVLRGENQGRSLHFSFGIRHSARSAVMRLPKASSKHRHLQGQCPKTTFKTGFCTV